MLHRDLASQVGRWSEKSPQENASGGNDNFPMSDRLAKAEGCPSVQQSRAGYQGT